MPGPGSGHSVDRAPRTGQLCRPVGPDPGWTPTRARPPLARPPPDRRRGGHAALPLTSHAGAARGRADRCRCRPAHRPAAGCPVSSAAPPTAWRSAPPLRPVARAGRIAPGRPAAASAGPAPRRAAPGMPRRPGTGPPAVVTGMLDRPAALRQGPRAGNDPTAGMVRCSHPGAARGTALGAGPAAGRKARPLPNGSEGPPRHARKFGSTRHF